MQLGCAPQHVLAVSLCAAPAPPAALAAAAAAGCGATLHLPPGDPGAAALAVLQRFATLQQALTGCLVVGYVMKRSRQLSLGVEGMLPLLPLDGLCFMPLDPALPLAQQQPFDILLQKPTDFLEEVPGSGRVPGFTPPLRTLNSQLAQRSAAGSASGRGGVVVIDPLERVQGVLDRAALAALLDGVCAEAAAAGVRLRSPRWTLLEAGQEQEAAQQLAAAGLHLPLIVKPQVRFEGWLWDVCATWELQMACHLVTRRPNCVLPVCGRAASQEHTPPFPLRLARWPAACPRRTRWHLSWAGPGCRGWRSRCRPWHRSMLITAAWCGRFMWRVTRWAGLGGVDERCVGD